MIVRVILLLLIYCYLCHGSLTTVHGNIGTIVGFRDNVVLSGQNVSVLKYLGIPYAESPAGTHRFKKAVPKSRFKTPYYAKTIAPRCYEGNSDRTSIATLNYTEDCLYLNIVVPGNVTNTSSLPVMVWIHGGALVYGSSIDYDADAIVAFGNVIVVTINYRLGVFGFLRSADGSLIGNQGLWDQHLAIKWVHDNIDMFNGNPKEITIFGESAGSESVTHQIMYGGNHGLFKRAIAESGSAVSYWTNDDPNADDIFQRAGCTQSTMHSRIACLRSKPAADLAIISNDVFSTAVVDGDFITERPKQIVYGNNPLSLKARDVFASTDLMIGVNGIDGALDLPYQWIYEYGFNDVNQFNISWQQLVDTMIPIVISEMFPHVKNNKTRKILEEAVEFEYKPWDNPWDPEYARNTVIDMTCHFSYFGPTVDTVRAHSSYKKGRTYMYQFAITPSNHGIPTPYWRDGANHADELPFVFGEPVSSAKSADQTEFKYTHDERMAAYGIMSMWINFAKTGNPNSPLSFSKYANVTWPEYGASEQSYLKMTSPFANTNVSSRLDAQKIAFWIDYLPGLIQKIEKSALRFDPSTVFVG